MTELAGIVFANLTWCSGTHIVALGTSMCFVLHPVTGFVAIGIVDSVIKK